MGTKKLNEVEKVTTMGTSETVPIILADKTIAQIPLSSLSTALADIIRTGSLTQKGLMPAGFRVTTSTSTIENASVITLKYNAKSHFGTLLSCGHYNSPALIFVSLGMKGGTDSGLPNQLKITTLAGDSFILSAKAFIRDNVSCVEIIFSKTIRYMTIGVLELRAGLSAVSVGDSETYNSNTDTDMITGIIA